MPGDPKGSSPIIYEIQVAGRLSPEWAAWFEGMQLSVLQTANQESLTVLRGAIADQAALFGTLTRIRDLGLKLISVNRIMLVNTKEES